MSELISKQSSRLLFAIIIPGFIGLFPWLLLLLKFYQLELEVYDKTLLLFVYLIFSIAVGLTFHLFAMKIEIRIDSLLKKCFDPDFDHVWETYLSLQRAKIENVRKKYMSFLIDRYQFQLNMVPSLLVALIGSFFLLNSMNWQTYHVILFVIVGACVIAFFLTECYHVGKLLHINRKRIISDVQYLK